MRLRQGTFSYLPDFTDDEIKEQVQYCIENEWSVAVEYTDDPHPRNVYWDMWGMPMFELKDAAGAMGTINECRQANPNCYVRVNGYDRSLGRQTIALSFIVQRPEGEPGFRLDRMERPDRQVSYTVHPYAFDKAPGQRYS